MSKLDSTTNSKPSKPYPDFPLFPHASGRWAKKICGKMRYFGPWANPQAAHTRYLLEREDWEAGRRPRRPEREGSLTVEGMVKQFLVARNLDVENGSLGSRTWQGYEATGRSMIKVFGGSTSVQQLGPDDFMKLRKHWQKTHKCLVTLLGDIRRAKVFFNWAGPGSNGQGYYERPLRFGAAFKPPTRTALLREREERGEEVFTVETLTVLLENAGVPLKAMILLWVNCGYGPGDCCQLERRNLDLSHGWVTMHRSKTANRRRCPLWPETVAALQEVLARRHPVQEAQYAQRVFITKYGNPYRARDLSRELGNVLERTGLGRHTNTPYDGRRTCDSIGLQVCDDNAVRKIMGYLRPASDMLGVYDRIEVSDDRLKAVSR